MPRERIISPESQVSEKDSSSDQGVSTISIRPTTLNQYLGQQELRNRLSIALEAAKGRNDPMEHVLLYGPPGLGKTTLAHVIASELGTRAWVTSGPALTKGSDLVGTLTRMESNDVLFIDEIHRLPATVEEYIYPAMEDYKIDFTLDSGMHARVVTYTLQPFTLIGATTRAGLLTAALRSRFGLVHNIRFYEIDELSDILKQATAKLGIDNIDEESLNIIASRSRGTPRIALRLLRRVRDYSQVRCDNQFNNKVVELTLDIEGIDEQGLDPLDRTYLETIISAFDGGPVGVEAIAATMGEDAGTLQDVVEPYLLQAGFLARTRQGRKITGSGINHLKTTSK
ncbi:MAG: Holliday junction branch migration DNA helicase RuvB [Phycisphaerales bacterium]|jgi:Holliday junction DNA helicase RuvB|nr:Holliday junction branch migration DNA helicase RuvB [Phycisphaerales bacterium]